MIVLAALGLTITPMSWAESFGLQGLPVNMGSGECSDGNRPFEPRALQKARGRAGRR